MNIIDLLLQMPEENASDLYLKVGSVPCMRVHGNIIKLDLEEINDAWMEENIKTILTDHQQKIFAERPDLDYAYDLDSGARYRINIFRQQGHVGLVSRLIRDTNLSFVNLHLPPIIREFAELPRGLVIITGATGSGKSTTLASMIAHINEHYSRHIMTIEDPIEFIHVDKKSIINQREVGFDTLTFSDALRHVVRQSPEVILIGEMRDQDTMMTAISAAQTGHLVLTTLHTSDVSRTLDRMINYFPEHLKGQIRQELGLSLEGIVCMRLLSRKDGEGRVPALEVLKQTPSVRKALLDSELWRLKELMQKGQEMGMQTFNQSLINLYRQDIISYEEALHNSSNPEEFKLNAKGMYTGTDSIGFMQNE